MLAPYHNAMQCHNPEDFDSNYNNKFITCHRGREFIYIEEILVNQIKMTYIASCHNQSYMLVRSTKFISHRWIDYYPPSQKARRK